MLNYVQRSLIVMTHPISNEKLSMFGVTFLILTGLLIIGSINAFRSSPKNIE